MPITKKRGAVFSIYADSPVQSTQTTRSTSALGSTSTINANAKVFSDSPTKRSSSTSSVGTRRALTALQPTGLRSSATSAKDGKDGKGKGVGASETKATITVGSITSITRKNSTRRALVSTSATASSSSASASTKTKATTVSKRQIEVFVDEPTAGGASPATSKSTTSLPPAPRKVDNPSPAKRTRATPRKSTNTTTINDENAPPPSIALLDSPAGNTRSRAHRESLSTAALRSTNGASPSAAMTRRRVLGEKAMDLSTRPLKALGKGSNKGRGVVFADSVLCDVSEAYGASGDEPEGFRTQRV